jgi:hypothetical protein
MILGSALGGSAVGRIRGNCACPSSADPFQQAIDAGGPKVKVYTRLDSPPQVGRGLSVSVGDEALANAARGTGQIYSAEIPEALILRLEGAGLATPRLTEMGGVIGREIRFHPDASKYIAPFFCE